MNQEGLERRVQDPGLSSSSSSSFIWNGVFFCGAPEKQPPSSEPVLTPGATDNGRRTLDERGGQLAELQTQERWSDD